MYGLPGAGKSFVARRFAQQHGFYFHDGDDDLPPDMRHTIATAQKVTEDMRDRFVDAMVARVADLTSKHPRVVLAQTFLKQRHRERFQQRFPHARWVLVNAPTELRVQRLARRAAQPLEPGYAQAMTAMFDAPGEAVSVIENGGDPGALDAALRQLAAG